MAGNTHGAITGLSDYFLNTSSDALDMDVRKRYFQKYAPEGMSFDDFNKAVDTRIFGRGNDMQGTSTFKKWESLLKNKYNDITTPKSAAGTQYLPSTKVEPNWQYYEPKPTGTSLVPTQNVPTQNLEPTIQAQGGKAAKVNTNAQQYQQPTGNQLVENQISTAKKEKEARAKSAARKAQQETAKTVQGLYEGFTPDEMNKIKTLGPEPFAIDSKGNVYNLNLEEDVKALKKARTNKMLTEFVDRSWIDDYKALKDIGFKAGTKLVSDISKGIVNSPQAQAAIRLINSPAARFIGKMAGPVGVLVTGIETAYGLNKVKENWNADGADWRSRVTDVQGAISPLTHIAAGSMLGPVGAIGGAYTGSANMTNKLENAEAYRQQNAIRQQAENELKTYGINPNATNEEIMLKYNPQLKQAEPPAQTQIPAQQTGSTVNMKQKMQNEIAKDTQSLPQTSGNMEQFINNQIAKYGGYAPESNGLGQYGQGNIDLYARPQVKNADGSISTVRSMSFNDGQNEVLIPTVSDDGRIMSNEEAIQNYYKTGKYLGKFNTPEEANAYAQQLHNEQDAYYNKSDNQQSVQNTLMPQPTDYAQQIMNMTPQGYVSSQDIMDKLNTAYANINQQINADPRYQGGVVQANNPYNIDEKELARLQRADQYMNAFGVQSDLAGQYAQQRQVMYEQQMANQLGVPYNDYIDATLEQRKARIANEAQQMENVLTLQAQQATDMKTRLEAMNKMQELRNEVATEMYKAELDAQTKKDVAMLSAVGGIAKTQAFTNAPSTMLQAAGQYAGNVGGVLGGNYMYSNLWAMTPEQRGMFMNAGRPISDEELQAFFGRMGNVPAQFRTQGGQMPAQPQSQGILPNIAQWIMGE